MAKKTVRVIFDNNAWNDIVVRDSTGRALDRLQQNVAHDTVQVLVTTGIIEETIAHARTHPTQARRRLEHLRELGRGHLLRAPNDMIELEVRGEPTDGRTFMTENDESYLYSTTLDVCDTRGVFVSPVDGKECSAFTVITDAETTERDSFRKVEKGAENEIRSLLQRESTKEKGTTTNEPGLGPDTTLEKKLSTWGEQMIQQAPDSFKSWVTKFLTDRNAPTSVIEAGFDSHPFTSAHVAYLYAHAARHFKSTKLWEKGDFYDRQYSVLSVAADVFVTSDVSLRHTCELMPFRPFQLLSTREFIDSLA